MRILYISSVPSPNEFYRIKNTIKNGINVTTYGMNESGFKFHTLILNGLCEQEDVQVYSLVGRNASIKTHNGIIWKVVKEQTKPNLEYKHLGFFNIPIIKQVWLGVSFFFNTLSWLSKYKNEEKYIIMDASYITVIPFVLAASRFGKCKTAAIFCDIYEYMAKVKDARNNDNVCLRHKIVRYFTSKKYKKLDAFVLLTEQMNQVVNILNKPYEIIEGLVDINMEATKNEFENKIPNDVIMYAGAIREQFGLKNLVEGFQNYTNDNARLWIFGDGDYVSDIIESTKKDNRIIFYGTVKLDDVISKEIEATLLINPRPADMEFTQYSFPSKNMEYMVSGTPILTAKLPGMPKEYYDYIYTIDGNTPQDITEALKRVLDNNSRQKLYEKGKEAKEYVLNYKNNMIQAKKIIDLLRS